MAESSNGSTLTFNAGAQVDVRSMSFTEDGNPIDITVLGSATHLTEIGLVKVTCTAEVVGVSALDVGDTGALAISWNDGGSESVAGVVLTAKEAAGSLDTELTTQLTFEQSA